jgi:hypothetical protein
MPLNLSADSEDDNATLCYIGWPVTGVDLFKFYFKKNPLMRVTALVQGGVCDCIFFLLIAIRFEKASNAARRINQELYGKRKYHI